MGFWTDLLLGTSTTKRVPIYISCPACLDEGYRTAQSYWFHADCRYSNPYLYLTEYADVYCSGCRQQSHISNWAFRCGGGRHNYRVPSTAALANAISTSGHMVTEGGQRWLINVLQRM